MAESKFTKGPWVRGGPSYLNPDGVLVRPLIDGDFDMSIVSDSTNETVVGGCGCCGSPFGASDNEESVANAHLIAAAPDLYAALEEVADVLYEYEDVRDGPDGEQRPNLAMSTRQMVLRILAKARGEVQDGS